MSLLREQGLKVQVREVLMFDPVWAIEASATRSTST
jgi:hypothetical protein